MSATFIKASVSTYQKDSDKCPICHGSGWETYYSSDGTEEIYGYPVEVLYARKCSRCSGFNPDDFDRTGVPDIYRTVDMTRFKWDVYQGDIEFTKKIVMSFKEKFTEWQSDNRGLYIWSQTPGSGKTMLACCLGKTLMMRHNLRMRFITAPDYMNTVSESYKRDKGDIDPSAIYRECELLILDDIGTQMGKEWQQQEMFRLIDTRVTKGLVTIYTSNMSPEKLNLDNRIVTRIIKTAIPIRMPEESVRLALAGEEQRRFLEKML